MGSRLGRRVISFANLPIKLLMPSSFNNINEIALKTIPSASKIEIKRVLESLYGFDVEKVSTLNMEGKKKKRGGLLIAKPDYKKAYVTLRSPLSISPELYPIRIIEEEKQRMNKQTKSSVVEDGEGKRHWLDEKARATTEKKTERFGNRDHRDNRDNRRGGVVGGGEVAKFPWSSMRTPATAEKKPEIFGKRDDRHRDRRGRGDVAKSPARYGFYLEKMMCLECYELKGLVIFSL